MEQALKELQAYSGQKLPTLDGFVAPVGKPLDNYERGFYQFTIELLPGRFRRHDRSPLRKNYRVVRGSRRREVRI